jgi:predicted enzyme related to lactoylglutathione lyase
MANTVVWFDLPATDLDRAQKFYSVVLDAKIERIPGMEVCVMPHQGSEASGCIVKGDGHQPSANGPLIYLNVQGRLDDAISKVEPNGGKILRPRHSIGQYGFCANVLDTEGNRVALHSM